MQEALNILMQDLTIIIIAHLLSTIEVTHRMAVLDRGRNTELGPHDDR
jgi:ABC-type multidrug transport system fused ATPase/permease subunit